MKAEERRRQERILRVWRDTLDRLNQVGPLSDSKEDVDGFGEVKDYLLDFIERCERILLNARPARSFSRRKGNSLPRRENTPDNQVGTGVENG